MVSAVCRRRIWVPAASMHARLPHCLLKLWLGQVHHHACISNSMLSAQYQRASLAVNSLACQVAMLPAWPHCTYQHRPCMPVAALSGCLTASNTLPRQSLGCRRVVPKQTICFMPVIGLSDCPNASNMLSMPVVMRPGRPATACSMLACQVKLTWWPAACAATARRPRRCRDRPGPRAAAAHARARPPSRARPRDRPPPAPPCAPTAPAPCLSTSLLRGPLHACSAGRVQRQRGRGVRRRAASCAHGLKPAWVLKQHSTQVSRLLVLVCVASTLVRGWGPGCREGFNMQV